MPDLWALCEEGDSEALERALHLSMPVNVVDSVRRLRFVCEPLVLTCGREGRTHTASRGGRERLS